ncbi:Alpha/beta hydrolase [Candidatus Koribacter versatilis Ellin345]|uniref:Alpha/beta hydrolase n=1 Tax=Koribacter versatilis (strain Ellin345) TaxID=204669 RepID=Q1IQ24_KORVE|nr:alpha/beta hydrolase [Candidatus Koribacter versatilis]ABF41026.1 Alpha/beta hydrolase [Candidatus Koribacter versatilis Ellin345]
MLKLSGLVVLFILASVAAFAQPDSASDKYLHIQTIRLWDSAAPGAISATDDDIPTLTVFEPWDAPPNHPAVIVVPGGAYKMLASIHEGREVADWFTSRGFTAFVLKYRLGPRYLYPAPLQDAQRAVRMVRSRAQQFGIDPERIGMLGFSAGGHLTAMAATTSDDGDPGARDPVDRLSSRLKFMVLVYPWLNAMELKQGDWISYCSVLEIPSDKCANFIQYSPLRGVSKKTPPTFIFHTADDDTVPVRTSTSFYQALQNAGVPVELHVYNSGPHGVGLAAQDPVLGTWPTLLDRWLRSLKLM